jgi:fumarate hydratase class II
MSGERVERDSLGEVRVPAGALYGAQTQRAVENFPISGLRLPRPFLRALGLIKGAAAGVNRDLGLLDAERAAAIEAAARAVDQGTHDAHFPIDVFQSGSGTSTNMNANEVVAHLAALQLGKPVHPNDHVNIGQSSNDVIPSAIQISAALEIRERLDPALAHLEETLRRRARELTDVVKTGRTHLMDALPVRLGQEIGAWADQVTGARARIAESLPRLERLPLGGTAVGTGLNAHPEFAARVAARLAESTGAPFTSPPGFRNLGSQDVAVDLSAQLRGTAVVLMKIANDLRLMNSGPLAGLAEIRLPAIQPGSSIMPGKVNPVIPESVAMVCAQVFGHDTAIALAGQSGTFQLNTMLPLIAFDLLESIALLAAASRNLADRAIAGFTVNTEVLDRALRRNPILVTALNDRIGYDKAAEIAKRAYAENRSIVEVAKEMTDLDYSELERLLDPARLTDPGR